MEVKYKKPSALLMSMIRGMAGNHKVYMESAQEKATRIIEQAKKEEIPNEQLRKLIEKEFKLLGISDRTLRKSLPPELKNQNMIRVQKKDPFVKEWQIEFKVSAMEMYMAGLLNDGKDTGIIVHDNKRVVDVYGK